MSLRPPALLLPLLASTLACSDGAPTLPPGLEADSGFVVTNPSAEDRPFFHDFGTVSFGERRVRTWEMVNTDREPVTVVAAAGACRCSTITAIRYLPEDGEPVVGDLQSVDSILTVPPGGKLELVVRIDTRATQPNHDKLAVMRISTTSKNTHFLTFEAHIRSEKLFLVTPGEARLGDVPQGYGGGTVVRIMTGSSKAPQRLVRVEETGEKVEAELNEVWVGDELQWSLIVTVPMGVGMGLVREKVVLATTDAEGEGDAGRVTVDVWAHVVGDVKLYPQQLSFGLVKTVTGGKATARLTALVPGARLKIVDARIEGEVADRIEIELDPIAPDTEGRSVEWDVVLVCAAGMPAGRFDGTLVLETDDSGFPRISSPFSGAVE